MELFNDPKRLAMLMAGINMMQASRGGNSDMSKGGFGYALGQGLQGGLQGYSTAKQFQGMDAEQEAKDKKQQALDDMLMKLNISPGAMQSHGVMRPGVQQGAQPFQNIPPERKQMAAMALQMGDVGAAMKAMIPDTGSTKGLDAFAPIYTKNAKGEIEASIPYIDPTGLGGSAKIPTNGQILRETPWEARVADLEAKIAGASGVKQAENSASASIDAFKQSRQIMANQPVYDQVVTAIDNGANTGAIASKFPSLTSASVILDNAAKKLGLGELSMATLGSITEKELDYVNAAALPINLNQKELREWVIGKKAADLKVAMALEDAAIYLGEPGNTIPSWLKMQKQTRSTEPKKTAGRFSIEVVQ